MKKHAFTLAEVLITLGIIGVVAAITIPSLVQKKTEQETAVKLKKVYSTLSNAYILAVQENGTPDLWDLKGKDDPDGALNILNKLSPYLKVTENCGNDIGCWPDVMYKTLHGDDAVNYYPYGTRAKANLADGTILLVFIRDANCAMPRGTSLALSNVCGTASVDINGFKGPNQYGYDFFQFYITKYGIVPVGAQQESDTSISSFSYSCQDTSKTGFGCSAWVIYNENLDYLHCNNLSWTGPTKCS